MFRVLKALSEIFETLASWLRYAVIVAILFPVLIAVLLLAAIFLL